MAQRKRSKKKQPESKLAELQERLRGGDLAGWGRGLVISGWVLLATAFVLGLFMGVPAMRRRTPRPRSTTRSACCPSSSSGSSTGTESGGPTSGKKKPAPRRAPVVATQGGGSLS